MAAGNVTSLVPAAGIEGQAARLRVGDLVVYGAHGIGRVSAIDGAGRGRPGVVVVEFENALRMTLPIAQAHARLRRLVDDAEIASVSKALRSTEPADPVSWRLRKKISEEKIASGEAIGLAEVVRDAVTREALTDVRGRPIALSWQDRRVYLQARKLLAAEVGAFHGTDLSEGDDWIERQLTPRAGPA